MLIVTLVFFALSIGFWGWMRLIASHGGSSVQRHVLERWNYTLREFMSIRNSPDDREIYLSLLFPWDVFFMISFGIFLAAGSVAAANSMKFPYVIVWAIVPFLYVLADFTENYVLYHMLTAQTDPESLITLAHGITRAKWVLVTAAILQLVLLFAASRAYRPSP
jgi:hypothetical protein